MGSFTQQVFTFPRTENINPTSQHWLVVTSREYGGTEVRKNPKAILVLSDVHL